MASVVVNAATDAPTPVYADEPRPTEPVLPFTSAIAIEASVLADEILNATVAAIPLPTEVPDYDRLIQMAPKMPPVQMTSDDAALQRRAVYNISER